MPDFNAAVFRPLIGQRFRLVVSSAETREATLSDVQVFHPSNSPDPVPADQDALQFSVTFDVPGARLPQATYELSHPEWGEAPLFLVPVAAIAGGIQYEAVFSRLPT